MPIDPLFEVFVNLFTYLLNLGDIFNSLKLFSRSGLGQALNET